MFDFTKRKFLELPLKRQHRKCAELLSQMYHRLAEKIDISNEILLYDSLITWMHKEKLENINPQTISDRYHSHLQLANCSKKEHHLLPRIRTGDRLEGANPWLIDIYLDHIRSAHNVGSIIRTMEAFRLGILYFSDQTPFVDHKQVQDTAMGAQSWITCKKEIALNELSRPIIALETSMDAISLYKFIFPTKFTLAIGNEEYGCSQSTLQEADYIVEIPLRGRKNSLNVANAFALVAGEIMRQRQSIQFQ